MISLYRNNFFWLKISFLFSQKNHKSNCQIIQKFDLRASSIEYTPKLLFQFVLTEHKGNAISPLLLQIPKCLLIRIHDSILGSSWMLSLAASQTQTLVSGVPYYILLLTCSYSRFPILITIHLLTQARTGIIFICSLSLISTYQIAQCHLSSQFLK